MKLVDDIIEEAIGSTDSVAPLLRKCLVLSYKLKNTPLRTWVEAELNGYTAADDLPDYRKSTGVAMGHFSGPLGASIRNQPLAASILEEEHQHHAREIYMMQSIATYEDAKKDETYQMPWQADLTAYYQSKFIRGYALHSAWMPIPGTMMVGLVDAVRTRVLTFALEIQAELPADDETAVEKLSPETVDKLVNVTIYGGNVVVGNVETMNAPTVVAGDKASLETAFKALGLGADDVLTLEASLQEDGTYTIADGQKKTVGKKTLEWIGGAAKKVGNGALAVGGAVAEEAVKRAVFGYLGL
ncbi:hypothetical protein [Devosia ginsengisoli]|uniref:AbiTii domain-containing protein n=1 Tax=Devosia ginsengisoli TaxID=400770 RepID=UPI0026EE4931|nr:hypothetical protein [Devosia ginsengisoli]MCR6672727.1 hypothetical protein [Devosia ginsengisoli]